MLSSLLALWLETSTPMVDKPEIPESIKIIRMIEKTFGKDAPVMIKISACESGLRHTKNGEVIKSKTGDGGVFQINQVHNKRLEELKLNPDVLEDNIAYAKILFDENGTRDWYMSRKCWSK